MHDNEPKLSVIVPVYKVEDFLPKCIDSILNQTYRNIEVILVDDGSPDNCPAICDKYARKDHRINVIHKTNGGLCSARNAGLDAASGDYVTFVDSDDWIEHDAYKPLISYCIENQLDIIGGDIV
ncbi:MAG: glycosyltransferase, partial [Muribaculaceae bacterium]|nr:glycosyltransferase [Muribaculaceae bacterium]